MSIRSTKCRLNQLSKKQIDTLIEAMPKDGLFDFGQGEGLIGFSSSGRSGTWIVDGREKIVTYTEMMQLLGKTMEFTKSDLKTGMFVKYRNGDIRLVLENFITGDGWLALDEIRDDLSESNSGANRLDIMSVYVIQHGTAIGEYFKGNNLTKIWERTEQTPAQKEMEELKLQISKLQEQAKVLQSKL
tara:strand:+ start:169 stop:729 length:561 start_codon:yes stop_codon:yes gene_type:complete